LDLATKLAIGLFLLGGTTWLADLLFAEDLKAMSRYARTWVFLSGLIFVIAGLVVLAFWPAPKGGVGPRIEVFEVKLMPPKGAVPAYINVSYKNAGDRPATAMSPYAISIVTPFASPAMLDQVYARFATKPLSDETTTQMQPGVADHYFSVDLPMLTAKQYAETKKGTGPPLYLLAYLAYRDGDDIIVTEFCSYEWGGALHLCETHNQIYRRS